MATSNPTTTWGPSVDPGSVSNLPTVSGAHWTDLTPLSLLASQNFPHNTSPMLALNDADPDEPSELFMDYEETSRVRAVLDCGVIPALSLLGVAGNCLCLAVFLRQRYHSVAKPLLLALCASDALFLLCALLLSLPCIVKEVDAESGRALRVSTTPQVAVLRDVMSRVTALMTLAVGVERSVAVTRPFKLRALCTVPRTRSAVLAIFLLVLVLQAPAFFLYDARPHSAGNATRPEVYRTSFYHDNEHALDVYFDYVLLAALRGLPVVCTCVCFGVVLVSLKRRLQCACPRTPKFGAFARAKGTGQRREVETENGDLVLEERKLTRALLAVILLRVVSELAGLVTQLIHAIGPDIQSSSFLVARDVSSLLSVLTSAINFILFMRFYKHFYVTFRKLLCTCN